MTTARGPATAASTVAAEAGRLTSRAVRGVADLSFDQPLPRGVVHKSGIGEVFLTDSVQLAPDRFAMAGELPRSHAFYSDHAAAPRGAALMAGVELMRQTLYVLAHRHLGVAEADKYVLRGFESSLTSVGAALTFDEPVQVVLLLRVADAFTRGGVVCGARVEVELAAVDGPALAHFGASYSWMGPERWAALRATAVGRTDPGALPRGRAPGLVEPATVGRADPANVVLAEPVVRADGTITAVLRSDPFHAPLYDHPGDHVSGMVLAEGWRQLAVWSAASTLGCSANEIVVDGLDCAFSAVAEFGADVACTATLATVVGDDAGLCATVTASQRGVAVGRAAVRLHRHS